LDEQNKQNEEREKRLDAILKFFKIIKVNCLLSWLCSILH